MAGFFKGDPNKIDDNGFTRLQRAISRGDLARVVALIRDGADVNYRGEMMYPPLHLALDKDRHGIALALIQAGADVNLQDTMGRTPLHHAAAQSQDSFVNTLLQLGADPNIADDNGMTPLYFVTMSRPMLIDALAGRKANLNVRDEDGKTPLHYVLDKPLLVDRLLQNGASPNIADNAGKTPFSSMLEDDKLQKYPQVIQFLLAKGADVDAVGSKGETLLHLSARLERQDIFSLVVGRADLSRTDKSGNNVLHLLAHGAQVGMIRQVLSRAPERLADRNAAGVTPLGELCDAVYGRHWATFPAHLEPAIRAMVSSGADIDTRGRSGQTVLHFAVQAGRLDLASYLLGAGAQPDLGDAKGRAPLHLAIEGKNMGMLDLLLDGGADPDLTDDRGWTVLDRLAEKGDRDSPVVQRLIVAGGQYHKQLPLNPSLMRPRRGGDVPQEDQPLPSDRAIDKSKVLRLPSPARTDAAAPLQKDRRPKPPQSGPRP